MSERNYGAILEDLAEHVEADPDVYPRGSLEALRAVLNLMYGTAQIEEEE